MICIINFKNTLFKRLTRGGPWAPSLVKQNLNRTLKCKVIAVKKNEKDFQGRYKGGPWVSPFMKQKLNRTQKHEAFTA